MSSFSIHEEPDGLVVRVEDATALNDFRSNSFRDAIYDLAQGLPDPKVALDLSNVDFLSSTGVAILVGLKKRIDGKRGKLVLFRIQPIVHDALNVVRLTKYFTIADDEPTALALLKPMPTV